MKKGACFAWKRAPIVAGGSHLPILFLNGLLLDGLGGIIERGGVLVEGTRIEAVGANLDRYRRAGTLAIDVQGMTILPGLVDTHVHIAGGDYFPGMNRKAWGWQPFVPRRRPGARCRQALPRYARRARGISWTWASETPLMQASSKVPDRG